jgi:acyl carrier protein
VSEQTWEPWFESTLRAQLTVPDGEPLDRERPLVAYGLNSFGWMTIATDLETWVTLPDELLLPSTFRTAGTLWAAVRETLAGAQA